jgi:hypothetical protein
MNIRATQLWRLVLVLLFLGGPSICHAAWPSPFSWLDLFVPGPDYARKLAVNATIAGNLECHTIGDFYWEIGDVNGRRISGRVGFLYGPDTVVDLASSSKLPFAAYFVQKYGAPNASQAQALTMSSGYRTFNDALCAATATVRGCENAGIPLTAANNTLTPSAIGMFAYSGGHFQKLGDSSGLASYTASMLTSDFRNLLGSDTGATYFMPGLAGGLRMSANGYAALLRKIMGDKLAISSLMTANRTCTLPGTCPTAIYSPLDYDWDYGLGHWIEHEPGGGDEAYSSVGLYGFYPWITADKQFYGIISMENSLNLFVAPDAVACGIKMRHAWLTSTAQF